MLQFDSPERLVWLGLVPVLMLAQWLIARARRRSLARFGAEMPPSRGRGVAIAECLGIVCVIVALCGPRGGEMIDPGIVRGRDLICVVDLSNSMQAEDMHPLADGSTARWAIARQSLLDLADAVQARGGHRLGLVVFAARPMVLCPLTIDYGHFRRKVESFDGQHPPPEIAMAEAGAPELSLSGTRIGQGLIAGVALHDPRFPGYRDLLLISDGDDPLDDREYQVGIAAAREAEIPVHVVGLGDPMRGAMLRQSDGSPFVVDGKSVVSRLNRPRLESIAKLSGGEAIISERQRPDLGTWFREVLEPRPSRELADDVLPRPRDQSLIGLGTALACFLIAQIQSRRLRPASPPSIVSPSYPS